MGDLFAWLISFFLLIALLVLVTYQVFFFFFFIFQLFLQCYNMEKQVIYYITLLHDFTFVAVNVPSRPGIWLYKSLWLLFSNKCAGFAWVCYASCPMLLLPCYSALDNGTLLRSLSFLQHSIVSLYQFCFIVSWLYTTTDSTNVPVFSLRVRKKLDFELWDFLFSTWNKHTLR